MIDCDLRRASVHNRLGLERSEPSFADLFTRTVEAAALIQATKFKNLYALTAWSLPRNPPALIAHPRVKQLLEELRREYRRPLRPAARNARSTRGAPTSNASFGAKSGASMR